MSGLLIVNADDWGGEPHVTDAIERCFAAGAITSSTAMVHMADTARAAEIARAGSRPLGLHLNFTQALDGPGVPAGVRERHDRLRAHFADVARRRWRFDPRARGLVRDGVRDQLEAFRAAFGGEPTHLDSHHHVHTSPDVFLVLPRGLRVRQSLTRAPLDPPGPGDVPRRLKHAYLAHRFRTTAAFWGVPNLHPRLGGAGLDEALERARRRPVEIMCHPSFPEELPLLLSDEWCERVAAAPHGSYATLCA